MKRIYYVENMTCTNCKNIIKNALAGLDGIKSVTVSLPNKEIVVEADFNKISDIEIISALSNHMYMAERR